MFKKTNGLALEIFRIVLGFTLIAEAVRLFLDFSKHYVEVDFLFKFSYLEFVKPLPESAMKGILFILLLAGLGIVFKKFYKQSLLVYLIGYTYFFLLDVSTYNNHYYLFILITFLMLLIPQPGNLKQLKAGIIPLVPTWSIWLLRFQLAVAYIFGGIAKLSPDWLNGSVMKAVFEENADYISPFLPLGVEKAATVYTYGGLLFDLFIIPLVLYKKTRWAALIVMILFHLSNAISLDIGVFPYFMIGASILFLDGRELIPLFRKLKLLPQKLKKKKEEASSINMGLVMKITLVSFVLLQILLPFRHHLIDNNTDWTGQGKFFSWRMKISHKKPSQIQILTFDKASQTQLFPQVNLAHHQLNSLIYHPFLLPQFLDQLAKNLNKKNRNELDFKINIQVGMNGRNAQQVYHSDNFGNIAYSPFHKNNWIKPLE